jgi:hypothetical protein
LKDAFTCFSVVPQIQGIVIYLLENTKSFAILKLEQQIVGKLPFSGGKSKSWKTLSYPVRVTPITKPNI